MPLLFKLGPAELCLSTNLWNRRVGVELNRPARDIHVFLGRWMLVASLPP